MKKKDRKLSKRLRRAGLGKKYWSKKWVTENEEMTKWYGFPINKNIFEFDTETKVGDKVYPVKVSIDRSFVEGKGSDTYRVTKSREHRGLPKYMVTDVDFNTRMTKNGTIFLSVNNLFNREYKEVKDYNQPGRYFTAGFSLKY